MAVIQGNTIHSIVFDDLEKLVTKPIGDPRQLSPTLSKMSGTVTGRIKFSPNPMWNLPSMKPFGTTLSHRYKQYLLRNLEVIAKEDTNLNLSMTLHLQGQPGDVLVTLSYMGKYRAYFWCGKKKHCWRKVDKRKYPDLMPQLRAALLLQT